MFPLYAFQEVRANAALPLTEIGLLEVYRLHNHGYPPSQPQGGGMNSKFSAKNKWSSTNNKEFSNEYAILSYISAVNTKIASAPSVFSVADVACFYIWMALSYEDFPHSPDCRRPPRRRSTRSLPFRRWRRCRRCPGAGCPPGSGKSSSEWFN